ncbi:hypothetical protein PS409_04990 [Pediococcus pentosaceus]|uniref:hypothetical protein n=1 Tax=Pediococcus pentosaceus TaxID=1255 RepID=UPI002F2674A7
MKFSFFNVILYKNDNPTSHNICQILDDIYNLHTPAQRTLQVDEQNFFSFPRLSTDDDRPQFRYFWIGKFLNERILEANYANDDIAELDGNAYSPTFMAYEEAGHLLMMQNVMQGVNRRVLEKFLNGFLPKDSEDNYEIKVIQQKNSEGLEVINPNTNIISINIAIKTEYYNHADFFEEDNTNDNALAALLNNLYRFSCDNDVPEFDLSFKKKNFRNNIRHTLIDMVRIINTNSNALSKALVRVKLNNGDIKNIDLLGTLNLVKELNVNQNASFDLLKQTLKDNITNNNWIPQTAITYLATHRDLGHARFVDNQDDTEIELVTEPESMYRPINND